MQDRYVGDLGDFGKYGLLRWLAKASDHKLGVVWYLYPNESHNADGKHVNYLVNGTYRDCDQELHDALRQIIFPDGRLNLINRQVALIEQSGMLPQSTPFYSCPLSFSQYEPRHERTLKRLSWLNGAAKAMRDTDIVFCDPDNGIECKSVRPHSVKGPKYIFMDDIQLFWNLRKSLVIYHHLGRNGSHDEQICNMSNRLKTVLPASDVNHLRFRRGTSRVYFLVAQPGHKEFLRESHQSLIESAWKCFL